jgi:putative ABC transport system permease protein
MILWEILCLAFSSLRANKLRSGLTMLGIAIGVFTVIGAMTVIGALSGTITENLNILGANSFQITKYPAVNFSDPRQRFANRRDITYEQSRRFKELMGDEVTVSIQTGRGNRRVFYADRKTNPNVVLIAGDESIVAGRNMSIARGRNISAEDVEFGRDIALIGNDVVKTLFFDQDPLGKKVRIDGQNLLVVGILAEKGTSFGQSQDGIVYIPVTQFLETYGRSRRSMTVNIQAADPEQVAAAQEAAVGAMRVARGLEPEDLNDFEIFSNESLIEMFNNIARVVATGAFLISAIALVASGIGVMNIMLVSVTERTREIGIRKSVGAKKRTILTQFLIEAIALSIVGGAIGVALGVGVGNIVGILLKGTFVFPWFWAATGFGVCGGIGVAFGLYPAWRAANLDPIEALRYE